MLLKELDADRRLQDARVIIARADAAAARRRKIDRLVAEPGIGTAYRRARLARVKAELGRRR